MTIPRFSERTDPVPEALASAQLAPSADFSAASVGGHAMQFTDLSIDLDGEIVQWDWLFGDEPAAPTAAFDIASVSGLTVSLTDRSTDVPPGIVTGWLYNFGDGSPLVTARNPLHTYQSAGSYNITLTVTDNAGTPSPVPAQRTVTVGGLGAPFGVYNGLASTTSLKANLQNFTEVADQVRPDTLLATLEAIRTRGMQIELGLAGGNKSNYMTDGKYDPAKMDNAINVYRDHPQLAEMKTLVAQMVVDNQITGNRTFDEPHHKGWGLPEGTIITKAEVDRVAARWKVLFPTLPQGVDSGGRYDWRDSEIYRVVDYVSLQYSWYLPGGAFGKDNPIAFRDLCLAMGQKNGVFIAFSVNLLDGGPHTFDPPAFYTPPPKSDGSPGDDWYCPTVSITTLSRAGVNTTYPATGGQGTFANACRTTPTEDHNWMDIFIPAGVGFKCWRYDTTAMADPNYQAQFLYGKTLSAQQPRRSRRRGT